ncbi:hypothetical protein [Larkinella sp. C7]|jgi:hypothetical protein|uniref:hypothetical protein n=1 Tax=Larkinella sp. C7 TaxID=2576607 RepID=UPI0011110A23|nr:hypothetical protein [Larkinella sp. C7]
MQQNMLQIFEVESRSFEIIVSSDVDRDGLCWELWEHLLTERILLSELFRNDGTKTIQYTSFKHVIPFEVLEKFIKNFNSAGGKEFIPDFHDK